MTRQNPKQPLQGFPSAANVKMTRFSMLALEEAVAVDITAADFAAIARAHQAVAQGRPRGKK